MHATRRKIKHRFIAELGINPHDYDLRRGDVQPYDNPYAYDKFDKIIIKTANDLFKATNAISKGRSYKKRHGVKLDVFWFLYACKDYQETAACVVTEKNGELHPIKLETVKRYERDIINKLLEYFYNNEKTREKIYKAIKAEYNETKSD